MLNIFILLGIVILILILQPLVIGFTVIGPNNIGVVEKWWSLKGSAKNGAFIATNGESGFQPDVLRAGIHFRPRIIFKVHKTKLVSIPQGQLGYVFARDGESLKEGQRLGRKVECNNFQDFKAFMKNQGQKGTQISILREGVYAINTAAFIVLTSIETYSVKLSSTDAKEIGRISKELNEINAYDPVVIDGEQDLMGIVTVHEGLALNGEIIAPIVGADPSIPETYHNSFQDPTKFIEAGGYAGRQDQVLTEGTYFINRKFATVEFVEKTQVPISYVGVINSFVGEEGEDLSGDDYKHGQLVAKGQKGVWNTVLGPGKYALNIYARGISLVPTHNFILKWMENEAGCHNFDQNLASIHLITKDAYEPTLPLSVVVNIAYNKAPLVIQRFGDIQKLVEQTLDPMVAAYFKNAAQELSLIELIQTRTKIQETATETMKEKFKAYNLELEEVLIGTPNSNGDKKIEEILKQLSDRQLSKEKMTTYEVQMQAAKGEKELNEYQAKAQIQDKLTKSAIEIQIQENQGMAELKRAEQDAKKTKTLADAESYKMSALAQAKAEEITKTGMATALTIREKVKAFGGPQYQVMQEVGSEFCQAIKESGIDIVPKHVINMGGSSEDGSFNAFNALMALFLNDKLGSISTDLNSEFSEEMKIFEKTFSAKQDDSLQIKESSEAKEEAASTIETI